MKAGVSKLVFVVVTAIAALLSLTAATYAWFTSNQEVSTTRHRRAQQKRARTSNQQ